MEEKKGFIIEEMTKDELSEFNKTMDSLSLQFEELHQQSIMMAHCAQRDAAQAFLNC